jgi:hypothetical protein
VNPQIQTVVESLSVICKSLNEAPKEWWNVEVEESEDEDDEVVDLQHCSPSLSKHSGSNGNSPTDSEQTEAFERPSNSSPPEVMDPIEGGDSSSLNRSCALPSQSPNFSPIAHMASQEVNGRWGTEERKHSDDAENVGEISVSNKKESPMVRFQQEATTITPISTVPSVMMASSLRSQDKKMLDKLLNDDKIKLHPMMQEETTADYAICGNAEFETGDGYLVGRTYGYLLAVASGISIVNISYLESNIDKIPDGKHQVIGDVDSSEWMAPQRAMESRISGGGTTLLEGYSIFFYGDFDSLPTKTSSKHCRSGEPKDAPKIHTMYSLDRLERLARTCGATILRDKESLRNMLATTSNDKVAVMLRPNPHPRDWRAANKHLHDYPTLSVICGDWLLDSIANFRVKEFSNYTHASRKK